MEPIISPSNPRIKALARLLRRKERERSGSFLVEGAREVERALRAGLEIEQLWFAEHLSDEEQELLELACQLQLPTYRLALAPLRKLSSRENPAGVVGVARLPRRVLADLVLPANPLVLVLVGLEKPGNLGAILRSADAAGVDAVLVVGGVDLFNPQVIRNSTGVVFSLPTVGVAAQEARDWLAQHRIPMLATTPHTAQTYWEADLRGAVAVVLGPEHQGLDPGWLEAAQHRVRIPMQGQADSLNVSVSAALVLYEARRQRRE